jgi:phosphoheptose isomerase
MASLLSYEAALRGNRLFIYGEGRSYILAVYMAQRLKEQFPDLAVMAMRNLEKDLSLFESHAASQDLLIAVTTAAESDRLPEFIEEARERDLKTVGLCSLYNSELLKSCDITLKIDSTDPHHVDEMHLLLLGIIADAIEEVLKS